MDVAGRAQQQDIVAARHERDHPRQVGAAGLAAPRPREQRRRGRQAPRQRNGRVQRHPEHERAAVVLVAELLEPGRRALLPLAQQGVGEIDDQQPPARVERQRRPAHEAVQARGVERELLLAGQAPDAAAVLVAQVELAGPGIDREAAERGRARVAERDAHRRPPREIGRQRAVEIEAIDLAGGVAAPPRAQDHDRAAVHGQLERPGHPGRDDLVRRIRARGRQRGETDEQGGSESAAGAGAASPPSSRRPWPSRSSASRACR